jgi:hypothetical protein
LGATATVTVPFAVPEAPAVIVTQGSLPTAVHEQPLPAVTVTGSEAPVATTLRASGATA